MVDFVASFNKGIDAAEIAYKNKQEIKSVFDSLNQQLDSASNKTLSIKTDTYFVNNTFKDLNLITNGKARPTYSAIVAFNPQVPEGKEKQLATWSIGRNGYPCKIFVGENQFFCEDKSGLEKSLQDLLSDPVVGEKLFKVMNYEEPTKNANTLEDKDDSDNS